ncbi:MAG: OmpH family outer membrane protein [Ignavibacteriae bacterium]|nr:OmpH family outer membrane protein [Ignavibacteriota bacterium]MCB9215450.1 OmpH family outer membrane protein [Ignavibacteria bacterium]
MQKEYLNRISLLAVILSGFAFAIAIVALVVVFDYEKIGVVRTADLIAEYSGIEDARIAFASQKEKWQREFNTLQSDYQKSLEKLDAEWTGLTKSEQQKRSDTIAAQKQNLIGYTQVLNEQAGEEEDRAIEKVMSHINECVRRYAEEHGYDVIYGATVEGSILYSKEALDITDELIKILNTEYETRIADGRTSG